MNNEEIIEKVLREKNLEDDNRLIGALVNSGYCKTIVEASEEVDYNQEQILNKVLAMKDEDSKNIPNSPLPWKDSYDMLVKENFELMGQLAKKDEDSLSREDLLIYQEECKKQLAKKDAEIEELSKRLVNQIEVYNLQKAKQLEFLERINQFSKENLFGNYNVSVYGIYDRIKQTIDLIQKEIARLKGEGK